MQALRFPTLRWGLKTTTGVRRGIVQNHPGFPSSAATKILHDIDHDLRFRLVHSHFVRLGMNAPPSTLSTQSRSTSNPPQRATANGLAGLFVNFRQHFVWLPRILRDQLDDPFGLLLVECGGARSPLVVMQPLDAIGVPTINPRGGGGPGNLEDLHEFADGGSTCAEQDRMRPTAQPMT